jgi:adhesin transport system membrane fusion protein
MNLPLLGKRTDQPADDRDYVRREPLQDDAASVPKTRVAELKDEAARRFDQFFVGADKLEDYYDDRFKVHSRIGITLLSFLMIFIVWAFFAKIDEVSRGEGKVVPSSKMQVIQSLEGGIAKQILIRQGQAVTKGQLILRLDDTGFSSSMGEIDAKRHALRAQLIRLQAELSSSRELEFPEDLLKAAPEIAGSELRLFQVRRTNFDNQSAILSERLQQRRSELNELKANLDRFTQNLTIAKRELDIKLPLAARKVVPETDVLRLQREISDLTGQVNSATLATPRLEAAIQEAERQLEDHRLNFRQTAQQELNQRLAELGIVDQSFKGAKDRVVRTDIRSPVDGIVNRINFTTVGGVVRPGEVIAEIVPLEDALLIEVKIKPSDIAFVHVGQPAIVRLTAYDFSIYGSLHGTVVNVSPDSITDQNTKETYYTIMVQTKESALRRGGEFLPILPGMIASVDVITGAKSVLQYILKPIVKAKESALRER